MRPFATLALVCAAHTAAAQAVDPRLERLDSAARAAVAAVLDSARAAALPLEPLVDKALEGAAKDAPGERIVAAVRLLAAQLDAARDALGPEASAHELDAGASALRVGVRPAALGRLRAARPRQSLTVPLAVLSDLVARGVPADSAVAYVLVLAPVVRDDELLAFQRDVERDIALGALPLAAAAVRLNSAADATGGPGNTFTQQRRRP